MYTWSEDTSKWYGSGDYSYGAGGKATREAAAARASAAGARTYANREAPNEKIISPRKRIRTNSTNPLIIAVDVTGSMASWPFEIFDRLPLLFNTLSQYREDLEICFAAIGDANCDQWPLQVTTFASGFDLEQLLGSLYGEGRGGDAPESYGLFAHWVNTHVQIPNATEPPFLIVFGDVTMHPDVPKTQIGQYLGDRRAAMWMRSAPGSRWPASGTSGSCAGLPGSPATGWINSGTRPSAARRCSASRMSSGPWTTPWG